MATLRAVKTFAAPPFEQASSALRDTAARLASQSGAFDAKVHEFRLPPSSVGQDLELQFRLAIDLGALRSVTPSQTPFCVAVLFRNNATRRSLVLHQECFSGLESEVSFAKDLSLSIPGYEVGRDVVLSAVAALSVDAPAVPGKARHATNILAEKRFTFTSRISTGIEFPNEWISFKDSRPENAPAALWHLRLPATLNEAPEDAFCLELNQDVESFQRLLAQGHADPGLNATRKVLLATIEQSVLTAFLSWALRSTESPPVDEDERKDSMWPIVFGTADRVDPNWDEADPVASFKAMQARFAQAPNDLDMWVQAMLKPQKLLAAILASVDEGEE